LALFLKRNNSSFSEQKEAKRLLFLGRAGLPRRGARGNEP
jgi:hypothetical protein